MNSVFCNRYSDLAVTQAVTHSGADVDSVTAKILSVTACNRYLYEAVTALFSLKNTPFERFVTAVTAKHKNHLPCARARDFSSLKAITRGIKVTLKCAETVLLKKSGYSVTAVTTGRIQR